MEQLQLENAQLNYNLSREVEKSKRNPRVSFEADETNPRPVQMNVPLQEETPRYVASRRTRSPSPHSQTATRGGGASGNEVKIKAATYDFNVCAEIIGWSYTQ